MSIAKHTLLGQVTSDETGRTYDVEITKRQHVVVVHGHGFRWVWPLYYYENFCPENAKMFHDVRDMLAAQGWLS